MALVLGSFYKTYNFYFNEFKDIRTSHLPFIHSPWPVVAIVGSYLYFVLNFGPKWMTNRKPFNLNKIINIYNLLQVVANFWFFVAVSKLKLLDDS